MQRTITFLSLLLPTLSVFSQGFSSPSPGPSWRDKLENEKLSRIGKTYTIAYGENINCGGGGSGKIVSSPDSNDKSIYHSKVPISFTIESVVPDLNSSYSTDSYYKVRLPNNEVGFIEAGWFRAHSMNTASSVKVNCVFEGTSEEYAAKKSEFNAEQKRPQLEAMAKIEAQQEVSRWLAKKPDARIGMTKKQVINDTNWGRPNAVNTTMLNGSVSEQWVYEGGMYLYFRNGRLTAIQTNQ